MRHPVTNKEAELHLTEPAFADALRVLMYSSTTARQVPLLIERALAGDFTRFSQAGVNAVRNMLRDIRMGLHFAITCNEFVSRIRPEEVQQATQGSYFGSWRVETQMAICDQWPRTVLPEDFFDSFLADVPAVLVSGSTDPASPPRWGEAVRSFMPQAIHVVVPGGGHIPDNPCTRSIRSRLFRTGASSNLDLGCVSELHPAPFKLAARRTRT
jgi:pimeloyl-ACP methyl ester carboxylesterase